ncbi:DUF5074 domain-containing protein [Bacteroidales bacterium OttesenSCG-928-C19]|nr:DUF5074 domain-containing protein [Bacteroidales bacterium OttesenSCG-928-C19]
MRKKSMFWLLSVLFLTSSLFAQTTFTVQGHPRPDLNEKVQLLASKKKNTKSGDDLDYSKFTFDSIKFWVGEGENRAALVIDWYDDKGSAMVWGFRWHKDSTATGETMLRAVAAADPKFSVLVMGGTQYGSVIAGLGYNPDGLGEMCIKYADDAEDLRCPDESGLLYTDAYDFDKFNYPVNSNFRWFSAWTDFGYWSYQLKAEGSDEFTYAPSGASSRILSDGDWDGWGAQVGWESMSGVPPRMPFEAALPPIVPFPEYEAYWPTVRKDTLSHMPIVSTPLAIEADSLVEKWQVSLGGKFSNSGQPLIINDSIYIVADGKIKILNMNNGELIREASLGGSPGFFSYMAYGEGKIFVPLADGVLKAFRADNLEQIWQTEAISGLQQLCEVTYHEGYVYTGMQKGSGNSTGTFYCVKAEDEDPFSPDEIKPRLWESFDKSYYWSGGTIVDDAIVFGGDLGALESRHRITGVLIDSLQTSGNIRCGTSYDKGSRRIFFTNKDGKRVYSIQIKNDGTFDRTTLKYGTTNGGATTVPVLYNNRLYVSVGSMTSGGGLDVIDANTMELIYSAPIGISQSTPLISTGYANEENRNTIYIYVTINSGNGDIICLKDFEGNKNPIVQYSYTPSTKQYSTHSLLTDKNGTMYYKNDAAVLIAYTNKPTQGEEKAFVAINRHEISIERDSTYELEAVAIPKSAAITWSSSDETMATVNQSGKVSVLKDGKAYIYAKIEDQDIADSCLLVSKYKLKMIAGGGGKITSDTDSVLNFGDDAKLSIAADFGYKLTDVLVNGISVGTPNEYTFTNIQGDSIIEARFAPVPAIETPYYCNFEDDNENENWVSVHSNQLWTQDRWMIGSKTQNGGAKSLYLGTSDGEYGCSTIYNFATAYRDITFLDEEEYMLTFDWICNGNPGFDVMKIYLLDSGATVTGAMPALSADFRIGKAEYCGTTEWKSDTIFLDGAALAEKTKRLAFQWTKMNIENNLPAPAIDNIVLIPTPTAEAPSLLLSKHTDTLYIDVKELLVATLLPESNSSKKLLWSTSNPEIAVVDSTGLVKALAIGDAVIFVSNEAGTLKDSCSISVQEVDYTKGTFFVNEDWFGRSNGSVNFLTENGKFIYRAYARENGGETLGATTQFGTIYGDNFYFVSKQASDGGDAAAGGGRLVVADAKTLKKKAAFDKIGNGDGRSFLGIDNKKGYIGTSSGIYLFDIDSLAIGSLLDSTSGGGLYSGQIGTMLRIGKYVFACKQSKGILVFDANTDTFVKTIICPQIGTIVQSLDGSLWATAYTDGLWRINPFTLEIEEKIDLPEHTQIPGSWGAWASSLICAGHKTNTLYWAKMEGSAQMTFFGTKVFKYDIDNPNLDTAFYELTAEKEAFYGSAINIDPVKDQLVITTTQSGYGNNYENNWAHFVDASSGELVEIKTLDKYYWFPSMSVFPDNYKPVIDNEIKSVIELNEGEEMAIYLGDKVTDIDNFNPAIIKRVSVLDGEDKIQISIHADTLYIKMIDKGVSTIQLICNSNGKIATKEIKVGKNLQGISKTESPLVNIYPNPTSSYLNITSTIGSRITIFDPMGRITMDIKAVSETTRVDLSNYAKGVYLINIEGMVVKVVKQ